MSNIQLEHEQISNREHKFPVSVICDNIAYAENVGMIFRVSEAMGVYQLFLCGQTPDPQNRKVQKTARSTEKYVNYECHENTAELITSLKEKDYTIVALEITNISCEIKNIKFNNYSKIALVIGNEKNGISEEVLKNADLSGEINMFGKNSSMNVVNALSIALYEITRQLS